MSSARKANGLFAEKPPRRLDKNRAWQTLVLMRMFFGLLLLVASASADPVFSELSPTQVAALEKGDVVVRSEEVPGGVWPRIIAYVRIKATVDAVERVFRDYASASAFIPGLRKAEVLKRPDPDTYDVRYTNTMPVVGDTQSTVRNRYSRQGNALIMRWDLIESAHAEESTGELRVEPLDRLQGSIMRYVNYVRPKLSIARLAAGAAANEVKKTVLALKKESERRSD